MAAHGEIEPMPDCAIFADTQSEPKSVYEWLFWLKKQLPFPVYSVTKGNLGKDELRVVRSKKSGRLYLKNSIPAFVEKAPIEVVRKLKHTLEENKRKLFEIKQKMNALIK